MSVLKGFRQHYLETSSFTEEYSGVIRKIRNLILSGHSAEQKLNTRKELLSRLHDVQLFWMQNKKNSPAPTLFYLPTREAIEKLVHDELVQSGRENEEQLVQKVIFEAFKAYRVDHKSITAKTLKNRGKFFLTDVLGGVQRLGQMGYVNLLVMEIALPRYEEELNPEQKRQKVIDKLLTMKAMSRFKKDLPVKEVVPPKSSFSMRKHKVRYVGKDTHEIVLPSKISIDLLGKPETGQGYQVVDIELLDGTILKNVTVLNATFVRVPEDVSTSDILNVDIKTR